jgi:hypothetical protein
MKKQLIIIGIIVLLITVGLIGWYEVSNMLNPIKNKFVGDWEGGAIKINIFSDGTVKYLNAKDNKSASGTWDVKNDILTFYFSQSNSTNWRYEFSNNDRTLTLSPTTTGQRIEFTKQ